MKGNFLKRLFRIIASVFGESKKFRRGMVTFFFGRILREVQQDLRTRNNTSKSQTLHKHQRQNSPTKLLLSVKYPKVF